MEPSPVAAPPDLDPDLEDIVLAYLQAVDAGNPPDARDLLLAYPHLASELREFIDVQEEVCRQVHPLCNALRGLTEPAGPYHVGSYEIRSKIAQGGMGIVYRAWQPLAQREVAVKVIRSGALASPTERQRFVTEARSVAKLEHPNIVRIYEVGTDGDQLYFSMEYAAGGSLAGQLQQFRGTYRAIAEILALIARAVDFAHRHGVIHRDLKPANILLTADGTPKVADFGLAKQGFSGDNVTEVVADTRADVKPGAGQPGSMDSLHPTLPGTILGTASYMAPEQARGEQNLSTAVDVYSLGAILYELLTGQPPFRGESVVATLCLVREQPPRPPTSLVPTIPRDLEAICLKCLEKVPLARYSDAAGMADDLGRFLAGKPIRARKVRLLVRGFMWTRRQPMLTALLVAVCVLSTALLTGAWRWVLAERARGEETLRQFYVSNLDRAERHSHTGQLHRAEMALDACPLGLRGWEWHYLRRLCHVPKVEITGNAHLIRSVCYSPDGKRLLIAGQDGTVSLWDLATRKPVFPALAAHPHKAQARFTASGRWIVTAGIDQCVRLWDARTGALIDTLPDAGDTFGCDEIGRCLVSIGRDNICKIHDLKSLGKKPFTLPVGHDCNAIAVSPDGSRFALAGYHPDVKAFETAKGKPIPLEPARAKTTIWTVTFSADGKYLIGGQDRPVLWELSTGKRRLCFEGTGTVLPSALVMSRDGKYLAGAFRDGQVRVWEVATALMVRSPARHSGAIHAVGFSPDGQSLAHTRGGLVRVERLFPDRLVVSRELRQHATQDLEAVAFDPCGKRLASRASNGRILVHDVAQWQVLHQLEDAIEPPSPHGGISLAFLPDPTRALLLAGCSTRLFGWELTKPSAPLARLPSVATRTLALGKGKSPLLATSLENAITIHDLSGGTVRHFSVEGSEVLALAFHPDGQRLASGGSGTGIDFRNASTGIPLHTFGPNPYTVHALAFSPDGMVLASAGSDLTIWLWDVQGKCISRELHGHIGSISGLAYHPGNSRLASCSSDGTIKIWDPRTGTELLTLAGHQGPVKAITFSPDGQLLASVGHDGVVRVWDGRPIEDETTQIEQGEKR